MQLDGRQLQIRRDVGVLDLPGVLDRLAAQHLRDERRRRDRGAAPEPAHPPTAGEGVLAGLSVQRYLVKSKQHLGNVANRAKFSRARSRLYRSLLL